MSPTAKRARGAKPKPGSGASEVLPGVFVGGWKDAVNFEGARFCVLDEPEADAPADAQRAIYDGATAKAIPKNLDQIAALAGTARDSGRPVLFFCGHGIRRGPLAAAWFLHRHEGMSLDAAYEKIAAVRPKIERPSEWIEHWEAPD